MWVRESQDVRAQGLPWSQAWGEGPMMRAVLLLININDQQIATAVFYPPAASISLMVFFAIFSTPHRPRPAFLHTPLTPCDLLPFFIFLFISSPLPRNQFLPQAWPMPPLHHTPTYTHIHTRV